MISGFDILIVHWIHFTVKKKKEKKRNVTVHNYLYHMMVLNSHKTSCLACLLYAIGDGTSVNCHYRSSVAASGAILPIINECNSFVIKSTSFQECFTSIYTCILFSRFLPYIIYIRTVV